MRRIITWEGKEAVPGVIIDVGALSWPEDALPVVWNFQHNDVEAILGRASDLRREEDGTITAEIELYDGTSAQASAKTMAEKTKDVAFTVFAHKLVETRNPKPRRVHAGVIRSVSMVLADTVGWD